MKHALFSLVILGASVTVANTLHAMDPAPSVTHPPAPPSAAESPKSLEDDWDKVTAPPKPPAPPAVSPRMIAKRGTLESWQVNVNAAGNNILGDAANEPSIAIDPTNPANVAIGWRQFDTINSDFREGGFGYSRDGGQTWTFPGVLAESIFSSDPVLGAASDGTMYYYALQPSRGPGEWSCYLYTSHNGGQDWPTEQYAWGGDKAWMVVDNSDSIGNGNIYVAWSPFAGCCQGLFTRSTDGGATFLTPVAVTQGIHFGTLAVGPEGEVYLAGVNNPGQVRVAKSLNALDPLQSPTFPQVAYVSLDGAQVLGGGPNPAGLLGQVWVAVDHSFTASRGNVYVACSVRRFSVSDPLDVMFSRSTDGGLTWSPPARINDDPLGNQAWQWFATMSVAPNGRIDLVWNDTRADDQTVFSELYYANSVDEGLSWSVNQPVSPPFNHFVGYPQQAKLGDYYHAISDDRAMNVAYAATFNNEQDVYFLRIEHAVADFDGDGDTDLVDYGAFENCFTGDSSAPGFKPAEGECLTFDSDADDDVDGRDFGRLQRLFTGDCAITITGQPQGHTVCPGASVTLQVGAVGMNLTYQWRHNGELLPGANAATLTIDPVTAQSGGAYRATVRSSCATATSENAFLAVLSAPAILGQPDALSVCPHDAATFAIAAAGVPPLSFQWQRNEQDVPNADQAVYTVEDVGPNELGAYRCRVTDGCGSVSVSAPATLDYLPSVDITAQPAGGSFCLGDSVFLFVVANHAATFQWNKDGKPIAGATEFFLGIIEATEADSGDYHVVVGGECDAATSEVANVSVVPCGRP